MEIRPTSPPILSPSKDQKLSSGPQKDEATRAATEFEALLVTRLLKSARAAKLGDDLLGNSDQIKDLVDEQRGRLIAQAAPLGLAQLIAKGVTQ
jgi:Rod binding domain-containing protein